MKLFKRVFISITRRKTASLVILLISFLMGNVMAVAISIQQSSANIESNLLQKVGGRIEIQPINLTSDQQVMFLDKFSFESKMNNFYKDYEIVGSYTHIEHKDFSLHFSGIELGEDQSIQLDDTVKHKNGYSILHGIENKELIDEKERFIHFSTGNKFTDEQMKNGDNVIIASENVLVNQRVVQPGDVIYFKIYDDDELIPYKVVGTFKVLDNKYSDVKNVNNISMFYTPNENIRKMYDKYQEIHPNEKFPQRYWVDKAIFLIDSSENLAPLVESMQENKQNKDYTFTSTLDTVDKVIQPIKKLSSTSDSVLLFSMIAMTFVLGLVAFYFIRDRKREIGIYMSLGIRKLHLLFQIILESVLTGMFAILLSIGSGWVLSQSYSSSLIHNSMEVQQSEFEEYIGVSMEMGEEVVDDYTIVIDKEDIMMLVCLSFTTILLSTTFPLLYILRLNPKEIMLD